MLRVTADGRVENPQVTESSQPAFAAATLEALAQWRFIPATKNGRPFATKISLPFSFAP
jgi:TonB family protein